MTVEGLVGAEDVRVTPEWLALREPADVAARSIELAARAARHLTATGPLVVHDLGGGEGAMARWLAPRLPGPQHWVIHDRDADLLELAVADRPGPAPGPGPGPASGRAADGTAVTVEARRGDITRLEPDDLAGASLVVASALLDMLTADELPAMLDACTATGAPVLLALSVVGRVALTPAEPLDAAVAAAFDAHQRRTDADGRRLLGPDAGPVAVAAFDRRGATVLTRPSPWLLDAAHADLVEEWLRGWIAAACDERPELAEHAAGYLHRRLDALAAGRLRVTVGHLDVLALPEKALPEDALPEVTR
jgi:hypothetical protein